MPNSEWSSPLASCSTNNESTDDFVLIPKDGWYAFFFGYHDDEASAHRASEITNSQSTAATGSYSLNILGRTSLISLPLQEDHGRLLCSLQIGKLIYLTEASRLSVATTSSPAPSKAEQADSVALKWRVSFHSYDNLNGIEKQVLGEVSQRKKSIVCGICAKCFPSVPSVELHLQDVHSSGNKIMMMKRKRCNYDTNDASIVIWTKPLQVIYQDKYMAVIVKPQGMPVQGTKPCLLKSDLLLPLRPSTKEREMLVRSMVNDTILGKPRPVHRLDAATGGLLVLAKTWRSESNLKKAFADRQCHKRYRAIVVGKAVCADGDDDEHCHHCAGVVDAAIGGKESKTLFRPVRYVRSVEHTWLTVLDLWPVTGRHHQIRKHMKLIGHPILGDKRYSGKKISDTPTQSRLCLWAMEITLSHPYSGESKSFSMEDPTWLSHVLQEEEKEWRHVQEQVSSDLK